MDDRFISIAQIADLEQYEDGRENREVDNPEEASEIRQLTLPTLEDAQRAAKRVAYIRKKLGESESVFASEEALLLAELEQVRRRKAESLKPFERRMGWYLFALEGFHRARLAADPKEKTIKLPAGDLSMRVQQPEWNYGDEVALGEWLQAQGVSDAYKPKYVPDKTKIKVLTVINPDGTVAIKDTGEVIPGVTAKDRPPKFEFKVS